MLSPFKVEVVTEYVPLELVTFERVPAERAYTDREPWLTLGTR